MVLCNVSVCSLGPILFSQDSLTAILVLEDASDLARKLALLPPGARVTDYISLGLIAKTSPRNRFERYWRPAAEPGYDSAPCRRR